MGTKFRFVCATRASKDEFFEKTAMGRSLATYQAPYLELMLFERNTSGLPRLYNEAIRNAAGDPAILVFVHDDVHLFDFFWPYHILSGLRAFDIMGLAGSRRRAPNQPSWAFSDAQLKCASTEDLSGCVAHGKTFPPTKVAYYGTPGVEVKLLDGLLLAAQSETLLSHGLSFDERFDFHFYDMDFCRQAEAKGVRMGTWTLAVMHESGGNYGTPAWRDAYAKYLAKWGS